MAAERLAVQHTAAVVDAAAKHAFHGKSVQLSLLDVRLAAGAPVHGHGGAVLPQLLRVLDTDLLCRAEAELNTTQV